MATLRMIIGPDRVEGQGSEMEFRSWATGEVLAAGREAAPGQVDQAVSAAAAAQEALAAMPRHRRAEMLRTVSRLLREREDEIARLITEECGKPIRLARVEVGRSVELFGFAADEANVFAGEVVPLDASSRGENRLGFTLREPLGVVGAITPFNFPLNLASNKIAPALAVGSAVVHKPSERTSRTALRLTETILEAGAPPGAVNVVVGGAAVGEALVTHPQLDMVTFTGSPAVGWRIKERSGRKRVALELGSNSATVIDRDADLERAVASCVSGSFDYSGQTCISIQRIYVHAQVWREFTDRFVSSIRDLRLGGPFDENTDLGPMIAESEAVRIENWVTEAVAAGARVLAGAKREGAIYWPTVLTDVPPGMKVHCLEAFAPVVTLTRFSQFDEAVAMVNDSQFGLQAGVFTNSVANAFEAARRLKVGSVIVNDIPTWRVDQMPYGGVKQSGLGREGVRYTMEEMTNIKLVVFRL